MTAEDALPEPVPRHHWRLDTGALVPWGRSLMFDDVDELLAQRASWVPEGKPKKYAPTAKPQGYAG